MKKTLFEKIIDASNAIEKAGRTKGDHIIVSAELARTITKIKENELKEQKNIERKEKINKLLNNEKK